MPFWAGGTDSGGGEEAAGRTHLPVLGGEKKMAGNLGAEWPVNAASTPPSPTHPVLLKDGPLC